MLFITQICLNHGFSRYKSNVDIVRVDSIFTLKCKTTTGKWGNLTQITLTSLLGVNFPNIWIPRLQIYQMQLKGNKACLLDSNATKLSKEFCTKLDDSFIKLIHVAYWWSYNDPRLHFGMFVLFFLLKKQALTSFIDVGNIAWKKLMEAFVFVFCVLLVTHWHFLNTMWNKFNSWIGKFLRKKV